MTTNMVQNTTLTRQPHKGGLRNGSLDLFSFLKKNAHSPQIQENTNDLLKAAYKMLESAERDLSEKDNRITALENLLTTDELTDLKNRRGFYASFKRELDRTNRGNNQGGVLVMIDLDHFKVINDTFGHLAGDKALQAVGKFLLGNVRDMDIAARIGGDEFIVLLASTSIAQSMKRAKQLGKDLNALSYEWQDTTIKIQASLGLKEYKQGDTIEGIIEDADKGMYRDKERRKHTKH